MAGRFIGGEEGCRDYSVYVLGVQMESGRSIRRVPREVVSDLWGKEEGIVFGRVEHYLAFPEEGEWDLY